MGIYQLQPRFTRKSRFLFVKVFACKRGAKYERLSLDTKSDLSYSVFTPQGHTSQLIPVTRKHQPPL